MAHKNKKYIWTQKELEILKKYGSKLKASDLSKKLNNKPTSEIYRKRKKLNIVSFTEASSWTEEEIDILKKFGSKFFAKDLLKKLPNRTLNQIHKKRLDLDIKMEHTQRYNSFSPQDDEIIRQNINLEDKEVVKLIPHRDVKSIGRRRRQLGLMKGGPQLKTPFPEYFNSIYDKDLNNGLNLSDFNFRPLALDKITFRCKNNKEHIFTKEIRNIHASYTRFKKLNCPFCKGHEVHLTESLKFKFPILSKSYSKKNKIAVDKIKFDSAKSCIFICKNGHEQTRVIKNLTHKLLMKNPELKEDREFKCDKCNFKSVYDDKSLLKYFDKKKNKVSDLKTISNNSYSDELWGQCTNKIKTHTFKITPATVNLSLKQKGYSNCPFCSGARIDPKSNSLEIMLKNSEIIFDLEKNNSDPSKIYYKSKDSFHFVCKKGHHFESKASNIFLRTNKPKCKFCKGTKIGFENTLQHKKPKIFQLIDFKKNKNLDVNSLGVHSHRKTWWKCTKNPKHSWKQSVSQVVRANGKCPFCYKVWDKLYLKIFLESLIPILPSMTQSERWVFFQQSGILDSTKRNVTFAKQLATQKFPVKEIEKFVNNEPSLVDDILDDPTITSEDYTDTKTEIEIEKEIDDIVQKFDETSEHPIEKFPEIKSKDVLKSLEQITSSQFCDKEAIEFLIISKKEKLWRDVFERGKVAVNEIKKATGNEYVKRAQSEFLFEYDHTAKLKSPKNFTARTNDGNLIKPNLMQFLTTTRLDYNSRIGNWSGTGAGKTLSAILASRLLDMRYTIVTCPNSVISNWQDNIRDAFKDSEILDKSNLPDKINPKKHNYLVLNYEYFQQPTSSSYVKKLLSLGKISFIVIDEVHYTKQREVDNVSKRKEMIKNLVVEAGKKNKNLKVIGMSATPVINNLFEGRSMIELITGKEHKDIDTNVNVNNCMYLFQKLSTIGTRYLPKYQVGIKEENHFIDCSDVVDEIREKGANRISVLDLELILTRKRIPEIIKHLEKKTVIYTHYIKGIGELLAEAISKEGYTVGFYTGEDKSGFDSFVEGNTDVLIGTSAIGTGVDGLQHVCRKLIFNVLPWTNAEYEQIKGRIFRQGQKQNVEFILPLTKAEVNGQEWSWCKTKLDRIHYKKTVADASVDGVIPEEHIRSEHQVLQDLMKWLDRLSDKGLETIERKELASTLFTDDDKELRRRKINHGDFTKINTRWNGSRSVVTHKRLQKNKSEWVHYHEEYRKARKDWVMTPYKEMIKFYKKRDGLVIGDFGCGEGFIYKDLSSKHTVHSFDHVAMEEFVTECDFSKTPLDDETLDVAIYSLSMMGSNINEYLHEAHRVLKLDGKINIIEATSRFKDVKQFMNQLQDFGFDRVVSSDMWKFTHIVAEKSDRVIKKDAKIKF